MRLGWCFGWGLASSSMNGGMEVVYRCGRVYLDRSCRRHLPRSSRRSFDVMYDENLMLDSSSRLALP